MAILSPNQQRNRSCLIISLILLVVVAGGVGATFAILRFKNGNEVNSGTPGVTPVGIASAIGVTITSDKEPIGISDGRYAFDTQGRPDKDLKLQASDKFKKGDITGAESLWEQATALDTNDAESLIYLQDQQVRASGTPYITVVVGTMLTGGTSDLSTGRDNLQGAYVAQKEYNDGHKISGSVQVVLLVANAGGTSTYANTVAQQIVQLAKQDKHIVGVMGWPFSSFALNAVSVLAKANIPMVSPTASSDSLTDISPYFFRVVPPNKSQAIIGARYAEQQLNARRAALFYDPDNAYSNSLASDFSQSFVDDGNQVVIKEQYTRGKPDTLPALLQDALNRNPDLIYFAGYSDDMGALLTKFPTFQSNVQLMGGDALYELGGYPSNANFSRLHFTAFAYPDEWDNQNLSAQKPVFFTLYAEAFDPQRQHTASPYGYSRPDNDVMLSYDAMFALLEACKNALDGGKTSLTPAALRQSLANITGSNAIQGVSGQISFGPDGDPIKKAVVVLTVTSDGHIKLVNNGVQGCFLKGQC